MSPAELQTVYLREPGGERPLRLPCRIGSEPGDDILVPGVEGAGVLLHRIEGETGVTALPGAAVQFNGGLLPANEFVVLQAGDALALGTARLLWQGPQADGYTVLEVRHLMGNATLDPVAGEAVRELNEASVDERIVLAELSGSAPVAAGTVARRPRVAATAANRRLLAVAAVLLLLVGGFAALLSQLEAVRVSVLPADAEVSASGFGWRSADRLLVLPGERTLRASAAGYEPLERRITVRAGEPLVVELQLKEKPGVLEIDTAGVSARAFIDGAEVGRVPGDLPVPAGERTLILRAERYLDHVATVRVEGRGVRQALAVRLQPSWGAIQVSSTTRGALLAVDAAAPVALPAKVDLPAGLHRLRIFAPGARDWQSAVLLRAGETQLIGPIVLGAPDARLRVTSRPAGAEVTVGGVFRGRTPLTVALPAGSEHDVGISLQGYRPASRRIFAESGKDLAFAAELPAVPVRLTVQGEPVGAEVFLGDTLRGQTPLTLELPARRYSLELRKAGMQNERIDVDLSAAVERTVEYKMVPVGRARDWTPPPAALRAQTGTLLRLIEGGAYTMGSERREQGRRANEFPRKVSLVRPFYLGTREVTNGEFRRFRANHASGFVGKRTLDLDGQPVSSVSWSDAVQYCNWLSAQEGLPAAYEQKDGRWLLVQPVNTGYRLPTEAEWEYVARHAGAGTRTQRYEWGDVLPPPAGIGNLAGSEAAAEMPRVLDGWQDDYQVVAPPGKFRANAFGIFDLTGNVSEWVHDAYVSFEANAGGTDPTGPPAAAARRVIKGSNWRTTSFSDLRAAWREGADEASQQIGFRVARYAE